MKKLLLMACLVATSLVGCSFQEVTGSAENVVIKYNAMGAPVMYWDVHEGVTEGDHNSIVSWSNPGQDRTYVIGELVVEPVNGNLVEIVQEYNLENTPHLSAP